MSARFAEVGRVFRPPILKGASAPRPPGWVARAENAKDIFLTLSPFTAKPPDRQSSLPQPAPQRATIPRAGSSPLPAAQHDGGAPSTPGGKGRLADQPTPAGRPPRSGSAHSPPHFTRPNRGKPRGRPGASTPQADSPASPPHTRNSHTPSDVDQLNEEETEPSAFTSPTTRGNFGSPSNQDDHEGLHHFSDDLLDVPHPFHDELIDDDARNGGNDGEEPHFSDDEAEARKRAAYDSGDADSDESYGKHVREEKAKRKRRKDKDKRRQEDAEAMGEQSTPHDQQAVVALGPSRSTTGHTAKDSGRPVKKRNDVTTGFDSASREGTSEEDCSDDIGNTAKEKGKGKARPRGRPPADALARCDALGESTRAEAHAIAQEYNMHPQTVLVRAGLALKATKTTNIANAVRKVFAHQYRQEHDGGMSRCRCVSFRITEHYSENAPHGAAELFYDNWKKEHGDDPEEHKAQCEAATALDEEAALDGITVHQLRAQALNISKQITQLVCIPVIIISLMFNCSARARHTTIHKISLSSAPSSIWGMSSRPRCLVETRNCWTSCFPATTWLTTLVLFCITLK